MTTFTPTITRSNGQRIFTLANTYGVSVIPVIDYLTGETVPDRFEAIIIQPNGDLNDDSVRGHLTEQEVQEYLAGVAILS